MAYMNRRPDGDEGPYPLHVGEYCGNHYPGSRPPRMYGQSQEEANQSLAILLAEVRFGKPRSCKAGTVEEMTRAGFVGLYLLKNRPLLGDAYEVNTPPELMEPGEERKYNLNGRPGISDQ